MEDVPASETRLHQGNQTYAALLRDEVFNIVPSTVNVTQGVADQGKWTQKRAMKFITAKDCPQVPDTLVAGGVPSVTFKETVSSTSHVRLHPTTIDLSGVSSPETSDREMEDELI